MSTTFIVGHDALQAFAHEALTVDGTTGGIPFTAATYQDANWKTHGSAKMAQVSAETAQMRYTVDGTAPTSTVGHLLEVGDALIITGFGHIKAFRAIRTGSSGALKVTYYR